MKKTTEVIVIILILLVISFVWIYSMNYMRL